MLAGAFMFLTVNHCLVAFPNSVGSVFILITLIRALREHKPSPRHIIIRKWENLDMFISRL